MKKHNIIIISVNLIFYFNDIFVRENYKYYAILIT